MVPLRMSKNRSMSSKMVRILAVFYMLSYMGWAGISCLRVT